MGGIMNKRTVACTVIISLMAAGLSGCGYIKGLSVKSQMKKVTKSMEEAQAQEVDRYASGTFRKVESLMTGAQADLESKRYQDAENKVLEAASSLQQAVQQAPVNKPIVQGKQRELQDLMAKLRQIVEKAETSENRASAEEQIVAARSAFDALQGEVQAQLAKRPQVAAEYDALITKAGEVGEEIQRAYDLTLAVTANELDKSIKEKLSALTELQYTDFMPQQAAVIENGLRTFQTAIEEQAYERAIAVGSALEATMAEQLPKYLIKLAVGWFSIAGSPLFALCDFLISQIRLP